MNNVAILLHPDDNVATALTDLKAGSIVQVNLDEIAYTATLLEDIAFGHKFALKSIPSGTDVLKYGLPIGQALQVISPGEWVHVHNCRSIHQGFRQEKYGLRA